MAWTETEQAVVDHLVAEPGPVLWAGPHGLAAVVASVRSGGGAGADPAAVQFRKTRIFLRCQCTSPSCPPTLAARDPRLSGPGGSRGT